MNNSYWVTTSGVIAALCWVIVATGAGVAVFHRKVRDTIPERIALAFVVLTALGTACRIWRQGWVSEGGMWLSLSFAAYVVVIFIKKWKEPHVTN